MLIVNLRITTKKISGKNTEKGVGRVSNQCPTKKSNTKEDNNGENEQKVEDKPKANS